MNNQSLTNKWNIAAECIDNDPMRPYRYGKAIKYLRDYDRNIKILEIGCGEGSGLLWMQNLGFTNLTGLEISSERIKRANNKTSNNINIVELKSLAKLPFDSGKFDAVLCLGVIEHFENQFFYCKEINRIAKPNAIVIISSDCYSWKIMQLFNWYKSLQPIDNTQTFSGYRNLFNKCGLKLTGFEVFNYPPRGCLLITKILNKLKLSKIDNLINRKFPSEEISDSYKTFLGEVMNKDNKLKTSYITIIKNLFFDENIFILRRISNFL